MKHGWRLFSFIEKLCCAFTNFKPKEKKIEPLRTIHPLPCPLLSAAELAEFAQRLTEVRAWCHQRMGKANAQKVLRSPELKPEKLDKFDKEPWGSMNFSDGREAVDRLSQRRRELLNSNKDTLPLVHSAEGKLLACYFRNTVGDTASESVSSLFIDSLDRPPWDTWIWCHSLPYLLKEQVQGSSEFKELERSDNPVLVCWIPAAFIVPDVSDAIDANPVNVLRWLSNEKNDFTEQLRTNHLLD